MEISEIPSKFPIPFAADAGVGFIRAIPEASQIGITNGAASLTDGFVPVNFQPVGAGGTPPWGADMNGILNQITLWSQWQNAGGLVLYDSGFSTAIGGYPQGAILAGTTAGVVWLNLVDNNTSNPDTGGANWLQLAATKPNSQTFSTAGTFTFTVPAGVRWIKASVTGGGGGGANSASTFVSGGGGAAGTAIGSYAVTPGQTITVVVGALGAAASGLGGNGGTSSFGSFCSATGGGGGQCQGVSGCAGGLSGNGVGGQINLTGGWGGDGNPNTQTVQAGHGGASFWGGGSRASLGGKVNAVAYGSGGGGGWGGTGLGGDGAVGVVLLEW